METVIRQRLLHSRIGDVSDYAVLNMLLQHHVEDIDGADMIADLLLDQFGSFSGIFNADLNLLQKVEGIDNNSASLIKLISHIIHHYMNDYVSPKYRISNIDDAKTYVWNKFICETVSCAYIICMSRSGKILYSNKIKEGYLNDTEIHPLDILRPALISNAFKVLLTHNHPNDDTPEPSKLDIDSTKMIYESLCHVGIELLDHIIVGRDEVYSMAENKKIYYYNMRGSY